MYYIDVADAVQVDFTVDNSEVSSHMQIWVQRNTMPSAASGAFTHSKAWEQKLSKHTVRVAHSELSAGRYFVRVDNQASATKAASVVVKATVTKASSQEETPCMTWAEDGGNGNDVTVSCAGGGKITEVLESDYWNGGFLNAYGFGSTCTEDKSSVACHNNCGKATE